MFCVHIEFHLMLGFDIHGDIVPPPAPPTEVPSPHFVTAMMNWVQPPSMSPDVRAMQIYGRVMQRGTDIQSYIPHIPLTPAILLSPLLTTTSGSKAYFGPATVTTNGAPIAAAIGGVTGLNLNCADIPVPAGMVIAPNTVITNMTIGDILGGLFAMISDAVIQALLNKNLGFLGPEGSALAQLFIGTPLGYSFNSQGNGPIGYYGRQAGAFGDLMRGFGEFLGGDTDQGEHDMSGALHKGYDNWRGQYDVLGWREPPATGGVLYGVASAIEASDRRAERDTPPGPAFDNPDAEQF